MGLLLRAVEIIDRHRWRWVLEDASGTPLADHSVALDPAARGARAFDDLPHYLRWRADPDRRAESEAELVELVGAWIGQRVLGEKIGQQIVAAAPVTVRVEVPPEGEFLLFRPLELAHVDGLPLARRADVSLVYDLGATGRDKQPVTDRLRMLALFSLPTEATALALRRERYELTRLVRRLAARQGRAVELQVLQYGVTRHRLTEAMTVAGGPDVLHISGHGGAGELLLETIDGSVDRVPAGDLLGLLSPAAGRVKLAVVSACESAAGRVAETLDLLGLTESAAQAAAEATAQTAAADPGAAQTPGQAGAGAPARLVPAAGIGQRLARRLDCAVVAMRYPVSDEFAIALADRLYEGLFALELPLDRALPRAVAGAAGDGPSLARPAISIATPTLFGGRAVGLSLTPPAGKPELAAGSKLAYFPPEPTRFVGRTRVMATASAALAPGSARTAVLFHGMAGAGKTACALELAYRHEQAFAGGLVFWQAPTRDDEFGGALADLAISLERQLGEHGFRMVDKIGTKDGLRAFLPRLSRLLADTGLLLVLDNLETLLTPDGAWRDPRWTELIAALTGHGGESRVVLTSRTRPHGLGEAVLVEPVHSLSRDESVLLARDLPNLRRLLHTEPGSMRWPAAEVAADRAILTEVLRLVQGHPKLLELADAAATDREQLATHLAAARGAAKAYGVALSAFFGEGESRLDAGGFLGVLTSWTLSTLDTLPVGARLLFRMLCLIEQSDRRSDVVDGNWTDLWHRLDRPGEPPELANAVEPLSAAALVQPDRDGELVRFHIHPGVAEAVRASAPAELRTAVDAEFAAWWHTIARQVIEQEGAEHSQLVVHAGLAAAPYLLRLHDWGPAAALLELALHRDHTPATLQAALPYLRRIVGMTGTLEASRVLAQALVRADPNEAEWLLRDVLKRAAAAGKFRTASSAGVDLVTLLQETGRLREALTVIDRIAEYTRRAGLGLWTQLADRSARLQLLRRLGQTDQVLTEVEALRAEVANLPDQAGPDEAVNPWNIREATLNTGVHAARDLGNWQWALDLNAEVLASKQRRDAGSYEIARTRFNDYWPLLRLGRLDQAEELLHACQQVFEDHRDIPLLGRVLSARADAASERGHLAEAIAHQQTALRLAYVQPDPHAVAVSHHNLANYLGRRSPDPAGQVAHWHAAALIWHLTGIQHNQAKSMWELARDLSALGKGARLPGSVGELAGQVERVEGVRFGALVDTLAADPATAEAALAEIIQAARDLPDEPAAEPQRPPGTVETPEELTVMSESTEADTIAALDDRQAVRVLALVVDRVGPVPDAAQVRELDDRLREAVTDPELAGLVEDGHSSGQPPDRLPATGGDLARTTLAHLATTPQHADTVRRAISIAGGDTTRFVEPATLAVGALVLLALQTEVELTRTSTGRWRLRVHKAAMSDSTLGKVLTKLVDLYRGPTG